MKQLIVDYLPFEITAQQINESMKENKGRLVVRGVLQRAEAKNQNLFPFFQISELSHILALVRIHNIS